MCLVARDSHGGFKAALLELPLPTGNTYPHESFIQFCNDAYIPTMARMGDGKTSVVMHRYELGRLLGQGTFAKVHHARNLKTDMNVAIKIVDKEKIFKVGMINQIKREISVMRLIRHPNVVQLYEVMATKAKIYFVMEYIRGGELFNKVAKGKLKEDTARNYFQQLISAVDYCHNRGVYHRDLKPENLLLDENGNLKVSDFGLSALADSKSQDGLLHTTCGTPAYVAPEVIHRKGYDGAKADIWSCGVVLFVLLAGYLPFRDDNLMEMYRKIGKADFKFPRWFSSDVRRLLFRILDPNPSTRISIARIMENPWFNKGYDPKFIQPEADKEGPIVPDTDTIFGPYESHPLEQTPVPARPCHNMNAFDIISFSQGLDLSGLFRGKVKQEDVRFTARRHASTIILRLEDIAKRLRLNVNKKHDGLIKFEGTKEGRKGVLCFDAEIFEVTPTFHIVEMKKSGGDTMEYQGILKQDIRPSLKDIVWTWQGDQQQQQIVHPQVEAQSVVLPLPVAVSESSL